jgi:hypothetical protein
MNSVQTMACLCLCGLWRSAVRDVSTTLALERARPDVCKYCMVLTHVHSFALICASGHTLHAKHAHHWPQAQKRRDGYVCARSRKSKRDHSYVLKGDARHRPCVPLMTGSVDTRTSNLCACARCGLSNAIVLNSLHGSTGVCAPPTVAKEMTHSAKGHTRSVPHDILTLAPGHAAISCHAVVLCMHASLYLSTLSHMSTRVHVTRERVSA